MNVETMIYAYLAICAAMILFNCVCIFVFRRRDKALRRHSTRLEKEILAQIGRVGNKESVEEGHKIFLQKKLIHIGGLRVFDETLTRLLEQDEEKVWCYLDGIASVFTYVAMENKYRNSMQLTYFAYVVRKYKIVQGDPVHVILHVMMKLLEEPGLYCRENALQVIYSSGDCDWVLRALHEADQSGRFHHSKLLTDGLLAFPGDQRQLAAELWKDFEKFSPSMKVVVLDYIRFSDSDLRQELLGLLTDVHQDDELRFSCIRYFGRNHYEPAYPLLLDFVAEPRKRRWEYAAIAVLALAAYPGEHTVEVLKQALSDSNWYIRFNASKSLESFHLPYVEFSDIVEGGDRYAREILQYRLDMKNAQNARKEAAI